LKKTGTLNKTIEKSGTTKA